VHGLLLPGRKGHGAVLAFFTPNVSVHGRELKVLQSKRTVPCCFSPRIKLPFKSLAALSGKKKTWRHLWNSAPAGGQLKFLDGQFSIQTLHTSPPLVGWSCRLIMVTVHFWFIKKKKQEEKKRTLRSKMYSL
jgi:hypothetical protein